MTRVFRTFGLPFVLLACLAISTQASAQDADADGVVDGKDNCLGVFNPEQRDADLDGYGTECDADYDNDGTVNLSDFSRFGTAFNATYLDVVVDHTFDGVVNLSDYTVFGSLYSLPPGPSGLACAGSVPCIPCSWGVGADQDGDGVEDDADNCVDGANGPAQAPNDQYDANSDGYGNFCDTDFNDDGVSNNLLDFGIWGACWNGSFQPICDLNADGLLNLTDFARYGALSSQPFPGPSGLVCDGHFPLASGFPTAVEDLWLNALKSETLAWTVLPASASYPHPLSTAVTVAPSFGTVRVTDGQTASFVYIPDPASSAWADEFRLIVSDGRGLSEEFTLRVNLLDDTLASFPVSELEGRTLVVYNVNAAGALDIAQHYVAQPARDGAHLCPVEMPNGLYASKEQMLSLRKQIVEECICPLVPVEDRPSPCEVGPNLAELAKVSPISHLGLVRGLPARMFGTGWPANPGSDDQGDEEEPSLDYYLAYLLYRDVDLFCPGCLGPMQGLKVANAFDEVDSSRSVREVAPAVDHFVSYGRIEAITPDRTMDLIDRTLSVEAAGLAGNLVSGNGLGLLRRTSTTQDLCIDYFWTNPWIQGDPSSLWPHGACRAGTTLNWMGGTYGGMPGAADTSIPTPVNVGALFGNYPLAVSQSGFSGFSRMRKWHRSTATCTELCSELPSAQQAACRASSTDYFQELNTECVGGAPGLIGMQYVSFPVGYYGFFPRGWSNGGSGRIDNTPPQILEGEGHQDATFLDDRYLHVGNASWNAADGSTCVREDGTDEPCPERVALQIHTSYFPSPAISLTEDRDFTLRLRRRHGAHPGADLRMRLDFSDGVTTHVASAFVSLATATGATWTPAEVTLTAPASQLSTLTRVTAVIDLPLEEGVEGFLDLDAVELIDLGSGSGANRLSLPVASFDPVDHNETHRGDFAANLIDRLGGIAAWGSSSHHRTAGHGFSQTEETMNHLLSGVSLGTSVVVSGNGESGIIYGDPAYRPAGALLSPVGSLESKRNAPELFPVDVVLFTHEGLTVTPENLATASKLAVSAFHGTANTASTEWSIATCPVLDIKACDDGALWSADVDGGTGAVRYHVIDWTTYIDPQVDQPVLVRLKVWNPATPADALYDFAFFDYQVNGS